MVNSRSDQSRRITETLSAEVAVQRDGTVLVRAFPAETAAILREAFDGAEGFEISEHIGRRREATLAVRSDDLEHGHHLRAQLTAKLAGTGVSRLDVWIHLEDGGAQAGSVGRLIAMVIGVAGVALLIGSPVAYIAAFVALWSAAFFGLEASRRAARHGHRARVKKCIDVIVGALKDRVVASVEEGETEVGALSTPNPADEAEGGVSAPEGGG